jgi:uncharacterized protein (TIGR04222 family)
VAVISLVDRGLLEVCGNRLRAAKNATLDMVSRPIEKAVLELYAKPGDATAVFDDRHAANEACAEYERTLVKAGLVPNTKEHDARTRSTAIAVLVFLGVGLTKLVIAFSTGHRNVFFLIVAMGIGSLGLVAAAVSCRRTERGQRFRDDLPGLFAHLKQRSPWIESGGATSEAVLLAAVFGLAALPAARHGYAKTLYPKAAKDSSGPLFTGGCRAACGTACGSSGGSSCGSSYGGGGGGGCGGCGGS